MRATRLAAIVVLCGLAASLAACTRSEVDVPAADPSQAGAPPSPGSGVLRPGFDPMQLAPPAAKGGAHDHHQHHGHGAHGATEPPPDGGHAREGEKPAEKGPADPHAGHAMPPAAPSSTPPSPSAAPPSRPVVPR